MNPEFIIMNLSSRFDRVRSLFDRMLSTSSLSLCQLNRLSSLTTTWQADLPTLSLSRSLFCVRSSHTIRRFVFMRIGRLLVCLIKLWSTGAIAHLLPNVSLANVFWRTLVSLDAGSIRCLIMAWCKLESSAGGTADHIVMLPVYWPPLMTIVLSRTEVPQCESHIRFTLSQTHSILPNKSVVMHLSLAGNDPSIVFSSVGLESAFETL